MSTPGRHATPSPAGRRTAYRGGWSVAAIVALSAVALVLAMGIAGVRPLGHHGRPLFAAPAGAQTEPPPASVTEPSLPPSPPPEPTTEAFATIRGLTLYLPATAIVRVGYHEASYPIALALTPVGRCLRDFNRTKFVKPPSTPGPDYLVMSSRGRGRPATSAADIAMRPGTAVLSPVTGVVVQAKAYRLYGRYPDMRIAIDADGTTGIQIVVIHVNHVVVRAGDRVFAGVTPIGIPRVFPFSSQVNDYIGPGIPHVHIEVNRLGPARDETSD